MRRGLLIGTLSFLSCLNHFKQHFINFTSSRLLKSLYSQFILPKCANNFGSIFPNHLDCKIYKTKFPTLISFCFSISICCITLTFPFMLKTFLLFMTVAMLSCYQYPVNCRSRNIEGNFMQKVNYCYYCHFPGLEFT